MTRDRLAAMRAAQQAQGGTYYPPPASSPGASYTASYGQQSPPRSQVDNSYEMQQAYSGAPEPKPNNDLSDLDTFMNEVAALGDGLKGVDRNVDRVRDLNSRITSELDGAQGDALAQQLKTLKEDTKGMIDHLRNRLHALNKYSSGPDANVRLGQIEVANTQFRNTVMRYRQIEQEGSKRHREKLERQVKVVNKDATPEEIREAVESAGQNPIFLDGLMKSNRLGKANDAYNAVQRRHREMLDIDQNISDLDQTLQDLAILMKDQDRKVIEVERQVAEASGHISDGEAQLKTASKSAAAARRKRWICFWIIVLLLLIAAAVIAVVIITNKHKN